MTPESRRKVEARAAAGEPEAQFVLSVLRQRESAVVLSPADRTLIRHPSGSAHWTTLPGGKPFPCRECSNA